jgi:TRAP-type C4-dicarboxylate transport system permease small subunit
MEEDRAARLVKAILRAATRLEVVLACALIAAVAMNVVNVIGRYVFGSSMAGVDELQIYLLVALAFFGSVVASVRGQHLRMDVLTRFFPAGLNRFLRGLEAVGAVVLCGFVCFISTSYALRMAQIGTVSENAHLSMWIPHGVVALAFAALTVAGGAELLLRCMGLSLVTPELESSVQEEHAATIAKVAV